jgi:hypothetical protein
MQALSFVIIGWRGGARFHGWVNSRVDFEPVGS